MTVHRDQIAAATASQDAARDWQALRDAGDIQFAPLQPVKPPPTPSWLKQVGEWLEMIFEPIGEALGLSWPVIEVILIALAAVLALYVLWRLLQPLLAWRRSGQTGQTEDWSPDRRAALALLEEADRLATEGRYGEATHLLLQRSVGHIAEARPDWLHPASTAREIASLPHLPEGARRAFHTIAVRVERSLFALRDLDADDWQAARTAYAEFALAEFSA